MQALDCLAAIVHISPAAKAKLRAAICAMRGGSISGLVALLQSALHRPTPQERQVMRPTPGGIKRRKWLLHQNHHRQTPMPGCAGSGGGPSGILFGQCKRSDGAAGFPGGRCHVCSPRPAPHAVAHIDVHCKATCLHCKRSRGEGGQVVRGGSIHPDGAHSS